MIVLITICALILMGILTLACISIWHIHGLEVAVILLGIASIATLSIFAFQFYLLQSK